jgi:hypothetical protein
METPEPGKLVPHEPGGATSHLRFHPEAAAIRAEIHKRLNLNHRGRPKGKRKFPIDPEELAGQARPATQEELEAIFGKGVTAWTPPPAENKDGGDSTGRSTVPKVD